MVALDDEAFTAPDLLAREQELLELVSSGRSSRTAVLSDGIVERAPALEGKLMIMILLPKPQTGKQKHAKTQDKQDGSKAVQSDGDGKDHAAEVAQQSPVPAQESVSQETA